MQKFFKTMENPLFLFTLDSRLVVLIALFISPPKILGASEEFMKGVSIDGRLEVEAGYHKDYEDHSHSDIILATAYLGLSATMNEWSQARLAFLYEENVTDLQIDDAYIRLGNAFNFTLGQRYLPFGKFETNLISDPLTYDMSHTLRTIAQLGLEDQGISGSIYAYRGENINDKTIDHYGVHLGFINDHFDLGIDYLNDFGDAHGPFEVIKEGGNLVDDDVSGFSAYALVHFGSWSFISEYLGALATFHPDTLSFANQGAKPKAWNVEMGYHFDIAGKETTLAIAYQTSQDSLSLELPKKRYAGALSIEVLEHSYARLEYLREKDYPLEEGGTGQSSDTITFQLATEF